MAYPVTDRDPRTRVKLGLYQRLRLLGVLFAAAGLVTAAACVPNGPASVVQHSAAVSEANALIAEVRVSLSRPARVFVEYDNPLAGRYRTALASPAKEHAIPIVRLRAETTYKYTVFTLDGSDVTDAGRGPGGSFTTGTLPDSVDSIFTTATGRSSQPLILSDHWVRGDSSAHFLFWDEVGALVWYVPVEHQGPVARMLGQENFVFAPRDTTRLRQFTPLAEVADLSGDVGLAHHDLVPFEDGRVLFPISRSFRVIGEEGFGSGGQGRLIRYDILGIWHSAAGRVEEVWNARETWNILDYAQYWDPADHNWIHLNSVSIGPHGNIVLSMRNRNQVVSLSPDYEIEWQLFGPDSDYEFPNPLDRFYKQHTAAQLANGHILLFDNGNGRPEAEGGRYSRALELRLDDAAGTAVKVWEYRPNPDIYSPYVCSAYRLTNGNTLVNFGTRRTGPLVVVEVDASGNEAFRAETRDFRGDSLRYRANVGVEAIRGETMLRPPTGTPSFEEHLAMRYEGMKQVAAERFDVFWGDGRLIYAKAPCAAGDTALRFFVHVLPKDRKDLPADRREVGFDNLDFDLLKRGLFHRGRCHAELRLPEYEIDQISTGQYVAEDDVIGVDDRPGKEGAWNVKIRLPP